MTFATQDFKDGVQYSGALTANTVGPFTLLGGKYAWGTTGASTSQTFSIIMPDGTTLLTVSTITTAATYATFDLPRGSYEITFVATSAVQGFLVKIPYETD